MPNHRTRFFQTPDDQPVRGKLIGIGSAGCNIIEGVAYPSVAFSTSSADLVRSHAERKVLIGQDRLIGVSDSDPDLVRRLPSVVGHELLDVFNNTELAFLMCGLGGTTGSLGAKMFSSIAKAKGSMGIAFAATPFSVESLRRREVASNALSDLEKSCALCVEFDNDKLSSLAPNLPLSRAFGILNGIMLRPVMDLSKTMARNDLGVFRQVVGDATCGRFGLGLARGDERVERVVAEAMSSPWFDYDLKQATAAVAIYSAADPWDREMDKILAGIEQKLPGAKMLWGMYADPSLGERIRLSILLCRKR
jgi:cell division protein FtsZ